MAQVNVSESHQHTTEEAKSRVAAFEEMLSKYKVKVKWNGYHADLDGMGVSGSIDVDDKEVRVAVKLGFLAKAAGIDPDRLHGSISRRLREALDAQ
jgi:putative polyhydroxyalkanoate system protein